MKANTRKQQCVLTVGLIVKNEERHLGNCLEALQPLIQKIPSEIVVVDTGSVDRTVEIAKQYTDKVYYFQWCDDFAAAKNEALSHAQGEWYFSIDADEYLDDPEDLIRFFRSSQRDKYNMGSVLIRNYFKTKNSFSDFYGVRLCRIASGSRFVGKIHEVLAFIPPEKQFHTMLNHYGYRFETAADERRKKQRNLSLLKREIEKKPDDLRTVTQIFDSSEPEERYFWANRMWDILQKDWGNLYATEATKKMLNEFLKCGEITLADTVAKAFLERYPGQSASKIDFLVAYSQILKGLGRLEESLKACRYFQDLFQMYHSGLLDTQEMRYTTLNFVTPDAAQEVKLREALVLNQLGKLDEAKDCLLECTLPEMTAAVFEKYLNLVFELCGKTGDGQFLAVIYPRILNSEKDYLLTQEVDQGKSGQQEGMGWKELFAVKLENFYFSHYSMRERTLSAIAQLSPQEDELVAFCRLAASQGEPGWLSELRSFVLQKKEWNVFGSGMIYFLLQYGVEMPEGMYRQSLDKMESQARLAAGGYEKFAQVVLEYRRSHDGTESISLLLWMTIVEEAAVCNSFDLSDQEKEELTRFYLGDLALYLCNIYREELLNDEDCIILPQRHQFGYHMMKAEEEMASGKFSNCVKRLRLAVKAYNSMKDTVTFLKDRYLIQFEELEKQRKKERLELNQLQENFKKKIMGLMDQGLRGECRQLIEQYAQLFPDDRELMDLYRMADSKLSDYQIQS